MSPRSLCRPWRRVHAAAPLRSRRAYASSAPTAGASEVELQSARAHCSNLLRKYDSPSFTLQTFIPRPAHDAYLALRAFNIELARVADATSNPTVGAMRMQFWRDAVTKALAASPPKQPVPILLAHAAEDLHRRNDGKSRLSRSWLHRIIATREQHLTNPPFPNLAALESYAENTYSTLLYLTLSALPLASLTADHLASHIGKATGIAAVLRGLPLIAFPPPPNHHSNQSGFQPGSSGSGSGRHGAVLLPLDVMAEAGVREEDVLRRGASAPGLRDAAFAVATRANDHLITAREMLRSVRAGAGAGHEFEHGDEEEHQYRYSEEQVRGAVSGGPAAQNEEVERAFGVLMQAVPTASWLERLQKVDFDVFDQGLRRTDWRLPWRAYWAFNRRKL